MNWVRKRGVVNAVVLWAISTYFILPVWWLFVSATKSQGTLNRNSGLWFDGFQFFENLDVLFSRSDGVFLRWLINALIYSAGGAAIGTVLAVMAGYALSKFRFRGREAVFSAILAGVLIPPAALALPLFLMFSQVGMTNSYASVLIPSIVSPLGVYLARVTIDGAVPDELLEAAQVDGAGPFRSFFSVSVHLIGPGMITIFLFQFVAIWNNFLLPLVMLNDRNLYPVTLGLYGWSGQFIQDPTLITSVITGSFVAVIPIILGFLALQRFWSSGLTEGAVKE